MEELEKVNWKEKEDKIENKEDFLNGLPFEESSDIQQMLYIMQKQIDEIKIDIKEIKEVKEK